jgi:hypothetical protein
MRISASGRRDHHHNHCTPLPLGPVGNELLKSDFPNIKISVKEKLDF